MTKLSTLVRRLRSDQRGDSMVEALAAILIASLGTILLATMVMTSVNVASSSQAALSDVYEAEETSSHSSFGNVNIMLGSAETSLRIDAYYSEDGTFVRFEDRLPRSEDFE